MLYVSYKGSGELTYELRDLQGRIVLSGINENGKVISIHGNTTGLYFLFLTDEQGNTAVQRIELVN